MAETELKKFAAGTRFWVVDGVPVTTFEPGKPPGWVETFAWDKGEPRPFKLTSVEDEGVEVTEEGFRKALSASA
jgi:hypothetical protein